MMTHADVLIVGGGLVGAGLACLIATSTRGSALRILVLDAQRPALLNTDKDPADMRVSAISRCSQDILSAADVWHGLAEKRLAPYRDMRVWDASGSADDANALHFSAADIGEPNLGHIIENRHIQNVLIARLDALENVEYRAPCRLEGLDLHSNSARAILDTGDTVTATLVIGADGARSHSRNLAGIEVKGRDYEQSAVVTHVNCEHSHENTAWQRFLSTGPLALLPLFDDRCSVVWSVGTDEAARLVKLSDKDLSREITVHSGGVLGALEITAPKLSFPLHLQFTSDYCLSRFALVGDAAHAVHPLAGQGVNLGFLDAACLSEVIDDALARHEDIGDRRVLRRYERWRKGENLMTMAALDGLQRLFGAPQRGWAELRKFGMGWVNRLTPVKSTLIRRAMGITGDLPRRVRDAGV